MKVNIKVRKSISVLLGVLIFMTAFAACGKQDGKSATNESTTATTSTVSEKGEKIDISIADYDNSEWGKDDVAKYIQEKFNVTIVPKPFSRTDYKDKVKLWAASDDLPDVFRTMGVYEGDTFNQFITNSLVRDIPESMLASQPNLKQYLDNNPVYKQFAIDNKIYSIPHVYWDKQSEDWKGGVTWGRKDWREKLGVPYPKTVDDWTVMMDAFANQDPDGNNKKDTYGLTWYKGELPTFMFIAKGAYIEEWVNEDNRWINGTYTKAANETVKYYKEIYDKGILDPEYVVMKDVGQVLEKFANNKAGVMLYGTTPKEVEMVFTKFEEANPGKKAEDCLEILLYPQGPDGKVRNSAAFNWFSDIEFSNKVNDDKLERILSIFDWTVSKEGDLMTRFGFENVDYKIENGKMVSLMPKKEDGKAMAVSEKYPTANIGYYYCQKSTKEFEEAAFDKRYVDFSANAREMFKGTGLENYIDIKAKFLITPLKGKLNPLVPFREAANKIALSGKPLDVDKELQNFWANYDAEYQMNATFDEVTKAMQK